MSLLESVEHPIETLKNVPRLRMRDISSWNGTPDMTKLNARIIAIKATEGTGYTSPVFHTDWKNAKEHDKARIAYHFFHPSISAVAQARFFLDTVKNSGLLDGDCLAIDLETTDGMHAADVAEQAVKFRAMVQKEAKCELIVYTDLSFARAGNCAGLGKSPLWIANPSRPAGDPEIPEPWNHWTFHQYGVTKGIDDDIANMTSLTEFDKLAILPTPPPLGPNQRLVRITDGKVYKETVINLENFVAGFTLTMGDATFKVL